MLKADTFDILLFKCKNMGAAIVRGYCAAEWDHAAMVIKIGSAPNEVYCIEVTSDHGVICRNF